MPVEITRRDYSLVGLDSKLAVEKGLSAAQWYACPIPRKQLKELMKRKDGPAIRDTLVWFAALVAFGGSWDLLLGELDGGRRSFSSTACSMARPRTAAGTNAAMAPRSRRAG